MMFIYKLKNVIGKIRQKFFRIFFVGSGYQKPKWMAPPLVMLGYLCLAFVLLDSPTVLQAQKQNQQSEEPAQPNAVQGKKGQDKQKAGGAISKDQNKDAKKAVSLNQLIHRLIEKNYDVRLATLDYLMATSDKDQFKAKYGFYFQGSGGYSYSETPEKGRNILYEGAVQKQKEISAFLSKSFRTGTRVSVGVTSVYQDSGVDGDKLAQDMASDPQTAPFAPLFGGMVTPPLYNTSLALELRQSLLRNFLGSEERNTLQMLDNAAKQKKIMTMQILSGLIVEALVYYWNMAILEENVKALKEQLNTTERVQRITRRKIRLGLSEGVELLQWNSLVISYENQLRMARKNLRDGRRDLLMAVQLPEDTKLAAEASLTTKKKEFAPKQVIAKALQQRPDLQSAKLQKQSARLAMANAKKSMFPNLDLILRAQSKGRDDTLAKSSTDIPSVNYPSYYVGVEMSAPLYQAGINEKIRDNRVRYEQAKTQVAKLEDQIKKEVRMHLDNVRTMYQSYQDTIKAEKLAYRYYRGILQRFRQGRFSSLTLKEAMDNYVKARREKMRALVGYNIAILRLQFAQNTVMERFGLDRKTVSKYIKRHYKDKGTSIY